jgi:cytochrome P450
MMGFANLAFAGGRDTIIHTVSSVIAYLSRHPEALEYLREDPSRIVLASEEFFRAFMPLTHIGRVCPVETGVHGVTVPAGGRVSLCWASANQDGSVFDSPGEVRLDRKPNPHLSFGFGTHLCLGALHARVLVRSLLLQLTRHVAGVTMVAATEKIETTPGYERQTGYESLTVRFLPLP